MKHCLAVIIASVAVGQFFYGPVQAVPINGLFQPDPMHCDGPTLPSQMLTHELGDGTAAFPFPINERISVNVQPLPVPFQSCEPDDGMANDWLIRIVNLSPISWQDLYFVADDFGFVVGNYDGVMLDLSNPGVAPTQAFRIDGTVTAGVNNPLQLETATVNEVFEPGETWVFSLINFKTGVPSFGSVGAFGAGSQQNSASTASILANPVPEPSGVFAAAAGLLYLLRGRLRNRLVRV